jgi:hypothetical protein
MLVAFASAVGALACGGCEALLDFSERPAPPDAAPPDAPPMPDPCGVLEKNDTFATAIAVPSGEARMAAVCPAGDVDFYKVTLTANQTLDFKILFKNAKGDLDLVLFDTAMVVRGQSHGTADNEEVKCPGGAGQNQCSQLPAGDYVAKVYGAIDGVANSYQLSVAITP